MDAVVELFPAIGENLLRYAVCFSIVFLSRVAGEAVKDKYKWAPHLPKGARLRAQEREGGTGRGQGERCEGGREKKRRWQRERGRTDTFSVLFLFSVLAPFSFSSLPARARPSSPLRPRRAHVVGSPLRAGALRPRAAGPAPRPLPAA